MKLAVRIVSHAPKPFTAKRFMPFRYRRASVRVVSARAQRGVGNARASASSWLKIKLDSLLEEAKEYAASPQDRP
jgi:hypothetical protein